MVTMAEAVAALKSLKAELADLRMLIRAARVSTERIATASRADQTLR
jgi:ribosomal protein L29